MTPNLGSSLPQLCSFNKNQSLRQQDPFQHNFQKTFFCSFPSFYVNGEAIIAEIFRIMASLDSSPKVCSSLSNKAITAPEKAKESPRKTKK
ncbi:hypothetical protein AVEN_259229-1 [Araneus ventricosus]|uniref:Uncharacterized protein n=1 Tax=Araneus ventricosus TaxID=182803 RepID=A0A4Y2IH50_ARAVE|nr:hypothetical protein AVEN_259229-1 [Araneus ventricosus]